MSLIYTIDFKIFLYLQQLLQRERLLTQGKLSDLFKADKWNVY